MGGRGRPALARRRRGSAAVDAVVLPGGFAHGDYLRPGALARFSPVMEAVRDFARAGGPVVGICNGFQVLTEAGLLPGALQKNGRLRFLCQPVRLVVASTSSVLTAGAAVGDELVIPINHFSGNYTCDDDTLQRLQAEDRIVLRYADNPNGSRGRHRRHRQRGRQRGRPHAAPRACQLRAARLRGRARAAALARRGGRRTRRRLTGRPHRRPTWRARSEASPFLEVSSIRQPRSLG